MAKGLLASIFGLIAVKINNEESILVYLPIPLGIVFFIVLLTFFTVNIIGPPR